MSSKFITDKPASIFSVIKTAWTIRQCAVVLQPVSSSAVDSLVTVQMVKGVIKSSSAISMSLWCLHYPGVIDHATLPSELKMPVHLSKCRASCASLPVPSRTSRPMHQQKNMNYLSNFYFFRKIAEIKAILFYLTPYLLACNNHASCCSQMVKGVRRKVQPLHAGCGASVIQK
ncbi:hypothetical protein DAPPUDRAFT_313992 [Daphnia pulex]|uniref:Uncharacterized protein n=1 Tax=Daphnia pulex TaxID=6669 RepID=E9G4E2_DAPPU|nr:hypothetical protein DAPPUDRAFT_313992 [Daphnia pulex]|eukprot:EFX85281.1 hypothetical protein DAPPUDRAFT_313992 [Daphnia pulex]